MEGSGERAGIHRSLSLIIPAYNEAAGIRRAIEEAKRALAELAIDYEILVVDDGSHDETAQIVVEAAQDTSRIRLLRHAENRGYGAALRTGFEAARFDRVAFTDADCQFQLADLGFLLPLTDAHPIAVGYRIDRRDPWRRRFMSWGYNTLARLLLGTGVRDCDCALKVFRRDALATLLPETQGFFVNTEMLTRARQLGYPIAEAGVHHRPRLHGQSTVSLRDIPRTLGALLPFWWSRLLFPAANQAASTRASALLAVGYGLLLTIVAALLCFCRIGCPLQEPEEPRYAEIPRQMLNAGSLAVPILHGEPYYDKPPLLYWLVMASYAAFGVHDWSARLIPAGATFLTVLLTYGWGSRLVNPRAGFAGALLLCLSPRFIYLGRLLTMNSLLCLCIVAALASAHIALRGQRLRSPWWLFSALVSGFGLLAKGPVALALVLAPIGVYLALDPRPARPGLRGWLTYLVVSLGLALPWYAWLAAADARFAGYFFWRQNIVRYLAPFDHEKPASFYLQEIALGMLPWTLLGLPLARYLGRRHGAEAARRPAALGFFLLAAGWCLLFHSAGGSKRSGYILPAMPALALALGCYLDRVLTRLGEQAEATVSGRAWAALALRGGQFVLGAGALLSIAGVGGGVLRPGTGLLLSCAALLALASASYSERLRRLSASWAFCAGATFAVLFAGLYLTLPGYARRFSLRGQARPYEMLARDPDIAAVCYPRCWDSVSFYLQRGDVRVYQRDQRPQLIADLYRREQTLAFIKSDHSLQELLRDLPGNLEFVPRGRQGGVAVGWVRRRLEVPDNYVAGR
jgi:4-amino-4-deoxy-L-arabinose transferase-like glycosyltransferase